MSGHHARPTKPAGEGLWRPLTFLAVVGLGPPLAIVSSSPHAHAAPAGIERPELTTDTTGEHHGTSAPPRYVPHTDQTGSRRHL
ncbi:hypothetical protein [Streptomyces lunalinharesii]|uniref:hypothetical protein n=1 Tax=Streptomyces lunalinharesii TaxID=333384 RepID=UPI0031E07F48